MAYTWSSVQLVRDAAYEVMFGGEEVLSPGQYRAVYFSSGER